MAPMERTTETLVLRIGLLDRSRFRISACTVPAVVTTLWGIKLAMLPWLDPQFNEEPLAMFSHWFLEVARRIIHMMSARRK